MRLLITVLLCAGCATPKLPPLPALTHVEPQVAQPPPPAPPPVEKPWEPPAPLATSKPAVPDPKACLDPEESLTAPASWATWRRAKLEAALRQRGLTLLAPSGVSMFSAGPGLVVGAGEGGCTVSLGGDYAIDGQHHVHAVVAKYPTRTRHAAVLCGCFPQCGGARTPPYVVTVSAPPDAQLGAPVLVTVPLEEDVTFSSAQVCPAMP